MGFLATAITRYFNPSAQSLGRQNRIGRKPSSKPCSDINTTSPVVPYPSESTVVPSGLLSRHPHGPFCLYDIETWAILSFSCLLALVATCLFIKHTDPFTACLVTFVFVTSLCCTLDFLFVFSKTNHIVPFSTFDILAPRFALVYQALR